MKVMMIVWIAALSIAYLVAGRSFEQALLAGKIVLFGFVLVHMAGNLKVYLGAEAMNHYGEWLRTVLIGFVLGFVGSKLSAALHAYREAKPAFSSHRR